MTFILIKFSEKILSIQLNCIHNEIPYKDINNKTHYELTYNKNINYNKYLSCWDMSNFFCIPK